MTDLKCTVENCIYNKESLCSKGDIMVGGRGAQSVDQTCCESFSQKREGHESYTSSAYHPAHSISVDCEAANCAYNQNYRCSAKHVDIQGSCQTCNCRETLCATFINK